MISAESQVAAAFGWLSAILTLLAMKGIDFAIAIHTPKWISLGIIVFMVFFAGFYVAFRAAYGQR